MKEAMLSCELERQFDLHETRIHCRKARSQKRHEGLSREAVADTRFVLQLHGVAASLTGKTRGFITRQYEVCLAQGRRINWLRSAQSIRGGGATFRPSEVVAPHPL